MTKLSWNIEDDAQKCADPRSVKQKLQSMAYGGIPNNHLVVIAEALIEIMDHIENVESGSDDDK